MQSLTDTHVGKAYYAPIEDLVSRSQRIGCCRLIFGALTAMMST